MSITISVTGDSMEDVRVQIAGFLGVPTTAAISTVGKVEVAPESREPNEIRAPKVADPIPVEETHTKDLERFRAAAQADEPKEIPYEQISTAVLKLSVSKGKDAALNLIKSFGAEKKASEIDPARFGEVLAAIDKLMGA